VIKVPEGKRPLEDLGIDGRRKLKWVFKKWNGEACRFDLAQERDRCPALVNAIMNLRDP
jgi:hypothetical protein